MAIAQLRRASEADIQALRKIAGPNTCEWAMRFQMITPR